MNAYINGKRIHLTVTDSTNSYTMDLLSHSDIEEWTVVSADHQTAGKGQRGRVWLSEPGQNLTFSVVLRPKLAVEHQFRISMLVSIALIKALEGFGIAAMIKWPNDILVSGYKIAGILVENQVQSGMVETSIIGIGLNVIQSSFGQTNWPATSMRLVSGRYYDREMVLSSIILSMQSLYLKLLDGEKQLAEAYSAVLYGRNQPIVFEHKNQILQGYLRGVDSSGACLIEVDGVEQRYVNGEIRLS